jgi:recombination protein RecT
MSTQLTKNTDLKSLINSDAMREQFSRALPKHLSPERFARVAITALTRVPKLAECTPASMMKCLLDLSAMGLEPDGRRAHLIPYGKEATLVIDYKGLIELIRRSGDVTSIRAETVCENDSFAWTNGQVHHAIDWRKPRGKVQAVYAEALMKSGEKQTAVMTHEEVEAIRKRSKAGNAGPWVSDWAEMAKKTAVRRLSKMLPLSSEIMEHVARDDDQFQGMRNVTPAPATAAPSFVLPEIEPSTYVGHAGGDYVEGKIGPQNGQDMHDPDTDEIPMA